MVRATCGRAFTAVELMIGVAIVATLAAIGIPLFMEAQAKAKFGELYPNLEALLDASIAYAASNSGPNWPSGDADPTDGQGKKASAPIYSDSAAGGWAAIGFRFDGDIRAVYNFETAGRDDPVFCTIQPGSGLNAAPVYASASSDTDGDGKQAKLRACEHGPGTQATYNVRGRVGQRPPDATFGAY